MTVLADTGALYALIDASDRWHRRVVSWWKDQPVRVLVPVTVVPELAYLLQTRIGPGAEAAFVDAIVDGEFEIEGLEAEDFPRIAEVMREYSDMPLGFVDASLVAMAERLDVRDILTTDRRHFSVVRPRRPWILRLSP